MSAAENADAGEWGVETSRYGLTFQMSFTAKQDTTNFVVVKVGEKDAVRLTAALIVPSPLSLRLG